MFPPAVYDVYVSPLANSKLTLFKRIFAILMGEKCYVYMPIQS